MTMPHSPEEKELTEGDPVLETCREQELKPQLKPFPFLLSMQSKMVSKQQANP